MIFFLQNILFCIKKIVLEINANTFILLIYKNKKIMILKSIFKPLKYKKKIIILKVILKVYDFFYFLQNILFCIKKIVLEINANTFILLIFYFL